MQTLAAVATAPEAETEANEPIVGAYALNGAVVPITQAEMNALDEWMQEMPPSVAAKISVAHQVARIID